MLALAKFALYAWVPFTLLVFAVMTPRRAVIFAYVGAWLFLPMLTIKFSGIPDLTKITAASFGVLLGASLFDSRTLLKFRPHWYDMPMLIWCTSPFVTSMTNSLGAYDGVASVVQQLGVWGIPYFIGRVYFNDLESFKELGIGIVLGALAYMPFVWLEMKISPILHKRIYGFIQHDIAQTVRWGSFRPMVFMQSGLALAMYMTTAALVVGWMWASGSVKKIAGMPIMVVLVVVVITQIFCKTMAATAFMFIGLASLYWFRYMGRTPGLIAGLPILVLTLTPPVYMYARGSGLLDRAVVVDSFKSFTSEERLQSLEVRLDAEDRIAERAFEAPNPWVGWGKWDPNDTRKTPWRVYREWIKMGPEGLPITVIRDEAPTDGLWMITLGQFGIVGVIFLTMTVSLPTLILWRRIPLRYWSHRAVAPVAAMSILLSLHMVDNLLNGMVNSIFMLALGGVSAIGPKLRGIHRQYGEAGARVVLDQIAAGVPATGGRGFPVQPTGYPQQPVYGAPPPYGTPPGYRPMPAGYGQPGFAPQGYGQAPRRRGR